MLKNINRVNINIFQHFFFHSYPPFFFPMIFFPKNFVIFPKSSYFPKICRFERTKFSFISAWPWAIFKGTMARIWPADCLLRRPDLLYRTMARPLCGLFECLHPVCRNSTTILPTKYIQKKYVTHTHKTCHKSPEHF